MFWRPCGCGAVASAANAWTVARATGSWRSFETTPTMLPRPAGEVAMARSAVWPAPPEVEMIRSVTKFADCRTGWVNRSVFDSGLESSTVPYSDALRAPATTAISAPTQKTTAAQTFSAKLLDRPSSCTRPTLLLDDELRCREIDIAFIILSILDTVSGPVPGQRCVDLGPGRPEQPVGWWEHMACAHRVHPHKH